MITATRTRRRVIAETVEPTKKEIIAPILEKIQARNAGELLPMDVVEEARPESSPLHRYFNWDDTAAAHQWRLWQARQLITLVLVKLPESDRLAQRYISLRSDRTRPGGLYRGILSVLTQPDLRRQLVMDALLDLKYWERKFSKLEELSLIYEAIEVTRKKFMRRGRA